MSGLHHVTAIAGDPIRNFGFYTRDLGLRFVKKTVNFDDPGTYHFYYGDETGRPGSILTFFPWPGARQGRHGTGQVTLASFAVPFGSLDYWKDRARRFGVSASDQPARFGEPVLHLRDVDGLAVELIASGTASEIAEADGADIPSDFEIRQIHSATLSETQETPTAELLTQLMGFR